MEDSNFRKGDAKTAIFGSEKMLQASPVDKIPDGPTTPEIAYQMVKDETFAQTQPRLNLATFVTTYMDDYATKLMNEAININYIDETEYPRIAVMNAKCINIVANLWNTPEQAKWKPVHWLSVRPKHVCWEVSQLGCAGVRKGKPPVSLWTSRTSLFLPDFRLYGKNSPSFGRSKCARCL